MHNESQIVLRKYHGRFDAMWRGKGMNTAGTAASVPSFGAALLTLGAAVAGLVWLPLAIIAVILVAAYTGNASHTPHLGLLGVAGTTVSADEVKKLFGELNTAFAKFREVNDGRVKELEAEVKQLSINASRLPIMGARSERVGRPEARTAFSAFLRSGDHEGMRAFAPQGAMQTQVGPDGGFAVPQEIAEDIEKLELSFSPLRRFARIRRVSSDRPEQLVNTRGLTSGWVGELEDRGDTQGDSLAVVAPPVGEIYALPSATQRLVDDASFDLGTFISESVAEEFAAKEGAAFVTGNGVNKPKGFLTVPTSLNPDATRPFGTLQFLKTGANGAFAGANPGDVLVDLVHSLRAPYRKGAAWWMNSKTLAKVRELKDGQGNYLWRAGAGLTSGQPDLLLGYPIAEDENAPDIANGSFSIAFGNWARGYCICDHVVGVRMLRDSLTQKGFVKYYTTKRVGGDIVNSQAIKLLQFSA